MERMRHVWEPALCRCGRILGWHKWYTDGALYWWGVWRNKLIGAAALLISWVFTRLMHRGMQATFSLLHFFSLVQLPALSKQSTLIKSSTRTDGGTVSAMYAEQHLPSTYHACSPKKRKKEEKGEWAALTDLKRNMQGESFRKPMDSTYSNFRIHLDKSAIERCNNGTVVTRRSACSSSR